MSFQVKVHLKKRHNPHNLHIQITNWNYNEIFENSLNFKKLKWGDRKQMKPHLQLVPNFSIKQLMKEVLFQAVIPPSPLSGPSQRPFH